MPEFEMPGDPGGIIADIVASTNAGVDEMIAKAKELQDAYSFVVGDIITGFGALMDGSKTLGETFSGIVTTMISDLGKLVIAEMLAAKKSIGISQAEATAKFITSIFKKIPFPLNIALAAGAFALVSKLFSKLLKFKEGGMFKEPTIAEVGHGTEYVLPEKKLIDIVRGAMVPGWVGSTAVATAGPGGFGGGIIINFNAPLISTVGVSAKDMRLAGSQFYAEINRQARRLGGAHG
jgi:hypothetical protein